MRSISILAIIATIGCVNNRADSCHRYLPGNDNVDTEQIMHDSADTGSQHDSSSDSSVDSAVNTDSASDSTDHDTASADSASQDTGSDSAADPCSFNVSTTDGEMTMANTLAIVEGQRSPGGAVGSSDSSALEVLDLELTVEHDDCPSLTVTGFTVTGLFSDYAKSGWQPSAVWGEDLSDGAEFGDADLAIVAGSIVYAGFPVVSTEIKAGVYQAHAFSFYADLSDASRDDDDEVIFSLYVDSVEVSDGSHSYVLKNSTVGGEYLVF